LNVSVFLAVRTCSGRLYARVQYRCISIQSTVVFGRGNNMQFIMTWFSNCKRV